MTDAASSRWVARYGDPCRECAYRWSISLEAALELVASTPERFRQILEGSTGAERHPDIAWNAVSYVAHVADNLNLWGERLVGAARSGQRTIGTQSADEVAAARHYAEMQLEAALWAVERASASFLAAVRIGIDAEVEIVSPTAGPMPIVEAVRAPAHDAFHHCWDVRRIVEHARGES